MQFGESEQLPVSVNVGICLYPEHADGDAAGSQLQEDLVAAFIEVIETAADAPLPGEQQTGLWRPTLQVA